jgi:hydrogenase maturation protease
MLTQNEVFKALSKVNDPELHRSLTELKMVREVQVQDGRVEITIALTVPDCPFKYQIEADIRTAVQALTGIKSLTVHMTAMSEDESKLLVSGPAEGSAAEFNHIQRVIAIMSGKGGVGKSLVTGLLATALAQEGYRVGILDADITGPSIPRLFGLHGPVSAGSFGLLPLRSEAGVSVMSFNLLLESEDQPVVWRGPLIGRAITQLWGDVMWGELDYLLVDLPPGTADASLTTMQTLPVSGIVMVTTPQSLSAMIVRKAVRMAHHVGIPILGVVENMAYFLCPDNGKRYEIFGPSHTGEVSGLAGAPVLARLPINPLVAPLCDSGNIEAVTLPEMPDLLKAFIESIPIKLHQND